MMNKEGKNGSLFGGMFDVGIKDYCRWVLRKTSDYPLSKTADRLFWYVVQRRAMRLRTQKEPIQVAFLINEIGAWKTETLYLAMESHPRFQPLLVVIASDEVKDADMMMMDFLRVKGYDFVHVPSGDTLEQHQIKPDIIFYEKPYPTSIHRNYWPVNLLGPLYCYVSYGFHNVDVKWAFNQPFTSICWKIFYEGEAIKALADQYMDNKWNGQATGIPMMDALTVDPSAVADPWKEQTCPKKRIIWAPHHTLESWGLLADTPYATFMEYADTMLELARKYRDQVQWAFKPHPLLHDKLVKIWGAEKTEQYFHEWATMENTQLEDGEYVGLFKHSDAMIHDCSSFTIEYHYTHQPVMYLTRGDRDYTKGLTPVSQRAFLLHQQGRNAQDIERFVEQVIEGCDPNKEERQRFYNEYLLPPHGKQANENIIDNMLTTTPEELAEYHRISKWIPLVRFLMMLTGRFRLI